MEEMPGRENFASDGHVLSPAKEVLMAALERAAQGAGGSLGAKAPPGGRDQLAVSNLVEEFGLIRGSQGANTRFEVPRRSDRYCPC